MMFRGKPSNRGQVLIIFVFAIIGLLGITGLAIDGGNIYSDRRHAQNAADTAALAGALTRVTAEKSGSSVSDCSNLTGGGTCGLAVLSAAQQMAKTNGYDWEDLSRDSVEVYTPPVDGTYSDCTQFSFNCRDYVEVIITSNVDTFFARVLGISQMQNKVEAVALAKYAPSAQLYGGDTLVALAPTGSGCPGEFQLGGTTIVTLNGGGIFVNSNDPCAFDETNCIDFAGSPQPPVSVVGGSSTPTSCTPPNNIPTTSPASAVQFPPDPIFTTPAECSQTPKAATIDPDGFTHLYPGFYTALPPSNRDFRLDPGVYCTDSVIKTTSPKTSFVGNGVLLWFKPGGYFSFQGGTVQLTAPTTGPYAGFLMYVDSTYQTSPDQNCTINGGANDIYTGVIYAPNCAVTMNGNSGSSGWGVQVIGYTFKVNGTSNLLFNYASTPHVTAPERDWTGLYH